MMSASNQFLDVDLRTGITYTAAAIFRGKLSSLEMNQLVSEMQTQNSSYFAPWISDNFKTDLVNIGPKGQDIKGSFLANCTSFSGLASRLSHQFYKMFKKKAYLQ